MIKKALNMLFIFGLAGFLCMGLARTVFLPKEINLYENRYANQVEALSAGSFLDQSFQQSLEKALADQIPRAEVLKKLYNRWSSEYIMDCMRSIVLSHRDQYFTIQGKTIFGGDHIVYPPFVLEDIEEQLIRKAENLNALISAHPDKEFYCYYVEMDTDIHFDTGEKVGIPEYLFGLLQLPSEREARFSVDSYEKFREQFYLLDHHWNHRGSYLGYLGALKLLQCQDAPLEPLEEVKLSGKYIGSKVQSLDTDFFQDAFYAYRFDYPSLRVTVNGEQHESYGGEERYLNLQEEPEMISYQLYYGDDCGEVIFESDLEDRGSILVLGDSFDNAVLRLLAGHFHRLYAVDLRHYQRVMGEPFHLAEYLQRNGIDRVLFFGDAGFFLSTEFLMED